MSLGRTLTLQGAKIPQLGFGTWKAKPEDVGKAIEKAIKVGYRHIDTALEYGNQKEIGAGIKKAGIPREELFITSKLWNTSHHPEHVEADIDTTLKELDTDYLDLYLIHWPVPFKPGKEINPKRADGKLDVDFDAPSISETWKEVVRIHKETKKARAVGVSNFTIAQLEHIINETGVVPAVNQVEGHPTNIQEDLYKFCKDNNILIEAYSPLGNNNTGKPRDVDAKEIHVMAKRLNKDPAQVLIAWGTKNGFVVLSKSVTPAHIVTNFETFKLSDKDFEEINEFGRKNRERCNVPAEYSPPWPINVFDKASEKEYKKVW